MAVTCSGRRIWGEEVASFYLDKFEINKVTLISKDNRHKVSWAKGVKDHGKTDTIVCR